MEVVKVNDTVTEHRSYEWNGYTPLGMIVKTKNDANTFETEAYQFITNQRGDILSIRDSEDNEVDSYTYDAYGNILTAEGALAKENPIRYAGYYYDEETKNYYLQARYYNPKNGSFLALDPYSGNPENPSTQNGYNYANGNPTNSVDSNGEFAQYFIVGVYFAYKVYKVRKYVKTVNGVKKYKTVKKKKKVKKTKKAKLTVKNVARAIYKAKRKFTANTKTDAFHKIAGQLSLSQLNKGVTTKFVGGDGKSKVLLEVKGYVNTGTGVKSGIFEYILDHEGYVTHQTFIKRDYYLRGGWGSRNKK